MPINGLGLIKDKRSKHAPSHVDSVYSEVNEPCERDMPNSMTGFARQSQTVSAGLAVIEIKTVNHRHLECVSRLGCGLEALEAKVRERVGQRLSRGRVEVSIQLEAVTGQDTIAVDDQRLQALSTAIEHVRDQIIDCNAPDALSLLNYPGVVERAAVDVDAVQDELLTALDAALDNMIARRAAEGERLGTAIRERLDELATHVTAMREAAPAIEQAVRDRLQRRLDALDVITDPNRLEQEVALAAQRMDVAEELERIESHRQSIAETLETGAAIGRRLDFWLQELMREVNTIGSKIQDSSVTAHVVDAKVLVEQMREQAQNIE